VTFVIFQGDTLLCTYLMKKIILPFLVLLICLNSCKKEDFVPKDIVPFIDGDVPDDLKINQIQYLGSHNSYRLKTNQELFDFITDLSNILPAEFNSIELDYEHLPLQTQLRNYGIRQLEIDLYLDQQGGLFYSRRGNGFIDQELESGIPELLQPGIKVMHIPDVDYHAHQLTFIDNLKEIKTWSDRYPEHIPVFILIELKETSIHSFLPTGGFAQTESWENAAALASLESEILAVFDREEILLPDDVRGNYNTLNEAVLNDNWPTIGESRGKVVFLHNNNNITNIYTMGAPSLENKLLFTNGTPGDDDAAFVMSNQIESTFGEINILAEQGYLIRTRSDAGTYEARNNDYSKWTLALQSGAHFISTDYYKADDRAGDGVWSSFMVQFNNGLYRPNPITGQ
jgi:hypothetical protein